MTSQELNRTMIEEALKASDWNYMKDQDGAWWVNFTYDEDLGCGQSVRFKLQGEESDIYSIHVFSDKEIPKSNWGQVIMLCNEWNKLRLFDTAYLLINDPDVDTTASLVVKGSVHLPTGISQEFVNDFTLLTVGTAVNFLEWAHKEKGSLV